MGCRFGFWVFSFPTCSLASSGSFMMFQCVFIFSHSLFTATLLLTRSGVESTLPLTAPLLLLLSPYLPLPAPFLSTWTTPHPPLLHFQFLLLHLSWSVFFRLLPLSLLICSSKWLSFVPQLSLINLVYSSHRLPFESLLLASLPSPLSLHSLFHSLFLAQRSLHTLSSPLSTPPVLSSSIALTFLACLSSLPFILPSSQDTRSSSFPLHFPLHRPTLGNKGSVRMTRQGIRQDRVNTAAHYHHIACVGVHIVWVLEI